jgi:hypothetical protein
MRSPAAVPDLAARRATEAGGPKAVSPHPPWEGGIRFDPQAMLAIAEALSRLHHMGWSGERVGVTFQGGTCAFVVEGRIAGRSIRAEAGTLVGALQQALALGRVA